MSASTATLRQDSTIIGLIGLAHGSSHFFQLLLPPLFPLLKAEFHVSYAQLGVLMMVFYTISGVCQTLAGFAVDRFGARRVLLFGVGIMAASALLMSIAPGFWALVACVVLAGLGNSVFHPSDFTILNARIDPKRLGHAFSVHGLSGSLGYAAAPLTMVALAAAFGWRGALFAVGSVGLVLFGVLFANRRLFTSADEASELATTAVARSKTGGGLIPLLTTPVLLCFAYFLLLAMALTGLQSFAIPALMDFMQVAQTSATLALTCYFLGNTVGVVSGGFAASWTTRHDVVAAGGMSSGALLFLLIAGGMVSAAFVVPVFALAGFSSGITGPSRDLIVRGAAAKGATGRVYGFVYSGLDTGSALTPVMLGWLLDHGHASSIFLFVGIVLLCGVATVIQVRQRSAPPAIARP